MPDLLIAATLIVALGCGLNAGVFVAFSSFVMKALDRLPAPEGIAAMQSINDAVLSPSFMTVLFGTAAGCFALAAWAILDWQGSVSPWLLIGGALYVAGPIALTAGYHQPRNLALATVRPRVGEAEPGWRRYVAQWTALNHVRTLTSLGSAAALSLAAIAG